MVEYLVDTRKPNLEITGPSNRWLHVRLMCIPGSKFDKRNKVWYVPRCWLHIVEIVITTHLNNLAKAAERKSSGHDADEEEDWLDEAFK